MPKFSDEGKAAITAILKEATSTLPGYSFSLVSADEILFETCVGKMDILDPNSKDLTPEAYQFFASTTKLITSICVLQLVEKGHITLDTPVSKYLPTLKTPLKVIEAINEDGTVKWGSTNTEITVGMMCNQTSGFGQEFAAKVTGWKKTLKDGEKGKGFVNSCKIDNLIWTPICEEPGTKYQYGNSAEWLGILIKEVTGIPYEQYLQENLCKPLGLRSTSFIPFHPEQKDRLVPLRWLNQAEGKFEVLDKQFPGLTLPRTIEQIEYPVGGGGLFTTSSDYSKVLQSLLANYTKGTPSVLLNDSSIKSLFTGTLPESAKPGLFDMISKSFDLDSPEEVDWSTGMCMYLKDGAGRGGYGRKKGSCFWMGAASSEYWIDPASGIACVHSSNLLPFDASIIAEYKKKLEKAVYEGLQ